MGKQKRPESSAFKLDPIISLGQKLILLRSENQIAEAILSFLDEILKFEDSVFLLVDETHNELFPAARRGKFQKDSSLRLPLDGERGIAVAAARGRQPLYVPDVSQDPLYVNAGFSARSELAVPARVEDRVLGVINVESTKRDAFSPLDVQILVAVASLAAIALEAARLSRREQLRAKQLTALGQLARKIDITLDLQETLDAIVGAVAELVPCSLAEISLWDKEQSLLVLRALSCGPERSYPLGQAYPPGHGYTGWIVENKRPLFVPDVASREDVKPDLLPGEKPFQAYIGLPLIASDELIGIIVLVHDDSGAFDREDLALVETMAGYAAAAIHKARLYEQLVHHHQELAVLFKIAETVNYPVELNAMMQQALDKVIEVTKAQGGAIRLLDSQKRNLILTSHRGLSDAYIRKTKCYPLSQEIVGWVARSGQPSLSEDMWTDPRVSPEVRELLKEVGHRSLAQVPLWAQDHIVGTMGLVSRSPGFFTGDDLKLLNAIGQQLGVAIENARLRQKTLDAERLAAVGRVASTVAHDLRDPLSGIIQSANFLSRQKVAKATRQKMSQNIMAAARRLNSTVQGILDYARDGRMSTQFHSCNLSSFLKQAIEVFDEDFSERRIEVVMRYHYDGDVLIDPDRMTQVIQNIAANARDAMPEGGRLTIRTKEIKNRIELRFSDTGPGILPESRGRIFEPFVSYGKKKGAGLGLSIARRIVEEHGGTINLDSSGESGASFVVSLPLAG